MQILMLLVVAAIIAFAVIRQLGPKPDAEQRTETVDSALPKVPMRPEAYKNFEQNMERFTQDAAEQQRRAIDAAAE